MIEKIGRGFFVWHVNTDYQIFSLVREETAQFMQFEAFTIYREIVTLL